MRRIRTALATTVLIVASVLVPAGPASAAGPVLPNLRMLRLSEFQLGSDPSLPGRKLLRFTATVVNVGVTGGCPCR